MLTYWGSDEVHAASVNLAAGRSDMFGGGARGFNDLGWEMGGIECGGIRGLSALFAENGHTTYPHLAKNASIN